MTQPVKEKVWIRDGKQCYICKVPLSINEATIDHINPKCSIKGKKIPFNLACCCYECNNKKSRFDSYIKDGKNGARSPSTLASLLKAYRYFYDIVRARHEHYNHLDEYFTSIEPKGS